MSDNVFQELKIRSLLDPVVRRKMAAYPLQFLASFDLTFDEKCCPLLLVRRLVWIEE